MKKDIVLIDWFDSCTNSGWHCPDDARDSGISSCSTVGYLLKRTRKEVTVCQNISNGSGQMGEIMSIPRKCITSIKELGIK